MYSYICYAERMERSALKYTRLLQLLLFIDAIAGLGATHVGGNQLFELGEGDRGCNGKKILGITVNSDQLKKGTDFPDDPIEYKAYVKGHIQANMLVICCETFSYIHDYTTYIAKVQCLTSTDQY